jgi:hypothetical protein
VKSLRAIWEIAKAGFLQRVRQFSFVAFCALLIFFTLWFVPRPEGFTAITIEPDVFLQGSDPSWMPMSSAMCGGMMLCVFGFAYLFGAVRRDRANGVLSLLRTSPTKRAAYLFGKLISNTMLLLCLLGVIMVSTFVMMEIRFPGRFLSAWDFFSPFLALIFGLPFVSSFALLMECIPFFGRKSGLCMMLFLCVSIVIVMLPSMGIQSSRRLSVLDFTGYFWMRDSISAAAYSAAGHPITKITILSGFNSGKAGLKALAFHGLIPSVSYSLDKLLLLAVSVLLTALASCMLPKTEKASLLPKLSPVSPKEEKVSRAPVYRFGLLQSELRKMLFGQQPLFWWIGAAGLWIACVFSPLDAVRSTLLTLEFAWLMPVLSHMGCMEHQSGMTEVLRTISGAMVRQASASWRAGAAITLITVAPPLLRFLISADWAGFLSALIAALLLPSVALFLGEWSVSNRPFEVLLLVLCMLALNMPTLFWTEEFSTASCVRMAVSALLIAGLRLLAFFKRKVQKAYR